MSQPAEGTDPDAVADDGISPAEAFALLGNDTRIEILQALLETSEDGRPVPFSELYDEVDIDDSAHFNYHLKKLTDHFVRRTDEGYTFRYPGWKVVRSVFAGTFNERAHLDPFEAAGTCFTCDGPLRAWYAEEYLTIECADCGTTHVRYSFPPGGLEDRTPAELLQAFHHHVRHHYCLAADGVCPECMGQVESTLTTEPEHDDREVGVVHTCQRCRNTLTSAVGLNLLDNAEVLSFHARRGVDLSTEPFWTFDWAISDAHTTVLSTEPLTVRIGIPCAGDEIHVTLDETLTVLETETEPDA